MRYPTASTSIEPNKFLPEAVRHLTSLDLARRWRMSTRTLERWRWRKHGPAFLRLGKVVVYRIEDVEAFEATQRHEPAGPSRSNARGGA
jgi:hypothetical protein